MNSIHDLYTTSLTELNKLSIHSEESIAFDFSVKTASNLDRYDYIVAISLGMLGAVLTTNHQIQQYLNKIHSVAGEGKKGTATQNFVGKLLEHQKSSMDTFENHFVDRNGKKIKRDFHRLLYGHDPLSIHSDNPFYLMIKQNGFLLGVIKAVRHLLADTMSVQGLPFPGSSFLDNPDENLSNYIISLCKNIADNKAIEDSARDVYMHIFTIRFQDLLAGGIISALLKPYFTKRKEDKIRQCQVKILSYGIAFIARLFYGIGASGYPYLSIPLGVSVANNVTQLYLVSNKETENLRKETEKLLINSRIIGRLVDDAEKEIGNYEGVDNIIHDLNYGQRNVDKLIDSLNNLKD